MGSRALKEDMTADVLAKLCRQAGLPTCPMACTQLFLSCQRFGSIGAAIREYVDVETIWLERNNLRRISNLDVFGRLRCLFLAGNQLSKIEGLSALSSLVFLSVSDRGVPGAPHCVTPPYTFTLPCRLKTAHLCH